MDELLHEAWERMVIQVFKAGLRRKGSWRHCLALYSDVLLKILISAAI